MVVSAKTQTNDTVGAARPDGTPVRVTKRHAETRARLLDAAFDVFAERGFGHVRISDVCDRAGYTRGAFYSNFEDLDGLFFALSEQRAQLVTDQVVNSLREAEGLTGSALVERVVDALPVDRKWILVKTDFLLYAARTPAVAGVLRAQVETIRAAIAEPLAAAAYARNLSESMRTADGLARAIITLYDGAMNQLLLESDDAAVRAWLTDLVTALLGSNGAQTRDE
jgi:AcrR family transcriptional regulator